MKKFFVFDRFGLEGTFLEELEHFLILLLFLFLIYFLFYNELSLGGRWLKLRSIVGHPYNTIIYWCPCLRIIVVLWLCINILLYFRWNSWIHWLFRCIVRQDLRIGWRTIWKRRPIVLSGWNVLVGVISFIRFWTNVFRRINRFIVCHDFHVRLHGIVNSLAIFHADMADRNAIHFGAHCTIDFIGLVDLIVVVIFSHITITLDSIFILITTFIAFITELIMRVTAIFIVTCTLVDTITLLTLLQYGIDDRLSDTLWLFGDILNFGLCLILACPLARVVLVFNLLFNPIDLVLFRLSVYRTDRIGRWWIFLGGSFDFLFELCVDF